MPMASVSQARLSCVRFCAVLPDTRAGSFSLFCSLWATGAKTWGDAGPLSAKLLKNGVLKTYKGFPHGMPTTQAETINMDLLAFIES